MADNSNTFAGPVLGKSLVVLRHRPFLIFWLGACISNTGNWRRPELGRYQSNHWQSAPGTFGGSSGEGLNFVWTSQGTRRLTIMGLSFMFLAAPLQGLLPVFARSVLKGGPGLFGFMLSAIGLGSILGAFVLSLIPTYYPRHHLIPLAMCGFAVIGLLFSFSATPLSAS